jgi:hypothetical protein
VPEVVEAHASVEASLLEAFGQLAAIERLAGRRVREDEIVVARVEGARVPAFEFANEPVAIGIERRVDRSVLPELEYSSRTKALRTRMRCACQSTSHQRNPRSSPSPKVEHDGVR